jgi:putative FmdB family regulatory protein
MPIYEYQCPSCNHKFELLRSMSDSDKEAPCPKCKEKAKRTLSRFASFSKNSTGEVSAIAGSGNSCSGCTSSNCATCGM